MPPSPTQSPAQVNQATDQSVAQHNNGRARKVQIRRRPRPGVTAAATTAVFATGDGPGVTALATTAVFATGWPMTPTLPTRAGLRGMSVPFGRVVVIGLDGRDDRVDGN